MQVGIFGGTFDPVHRGHIALATAAKSAFSLEKVLFIPGHRTPFKRFVRTASDADRLEMVRLAVAGIPGFEVSTMEFDRGGVSYTADTLEILHAAHPDWTLWLLLGADSLQGLRHWHRAGDIVRLARIGTIHRPGVTLRDADWNAFPAEVADRIRAGIVEGDCPDISSSDIRRRLAAGESVASLVPPAVADYIARRSLYAATPDAEEAGDESP